MGNDKLSELLRSVDEAAPAPTALSGDLANTVRSRAADRHRKQRVVFKTAAAVVIIALGAWGLTVIDTRSESQEPTASLEAEVKQLNAKVDSLLSIVHEALEDQQRDRRMASMAVELATIPDPIKEMNRNIDKVVLNLLYKADNIESNYFSIEAYKRIIKLFPDNYYSEVARQRIKEIDDKQVKVNYKKGDLT